MEQQRVLVYRPEGLTPPALPWQVRSVGWRRLGGPWREAHPPRPFVQIWWGESGQGELRGAGGRVLTLGPGSVAWFLPNEPHRISCHGPWTYRWLTLDFGDIAAFLAACGYDHRQRLLEPGCAAPTALFERLSAELSDPRGARRAFATAVQILTQAVEPPPVDDDPLVSRCLSLIESDFRDPQCGVASLAEALRVHRATLHRRCQRVWGMGPGPRLQGCRLAALLDALGNAPGSIAAIARSCGFEDPAYAARVVRRATGLPPRALRGLVQ